MERVFTNDPSITRAEKIYRAARFGDRTRCPECGYTRKLWRLEDGRWRCARCRKRFGLLTGTPLARERFSLPEIYELLHWFELGLSDHGIAQRVEVRYHRVHRFFAGRVELGFGGDTKSRHVRGANELSVKVVLNVA